MTKKLFLSSVLILASFSLSACNTAGRVLNPFYEPPGEYAYGGKANDHALNDSANKVDSARQALEAANTYQAAHMPTPNKPVYKPAVVRILWVPDHLDKNGNLVAAHYRYVEVKRGEFNASDAFEIERQLGSTIGGSNISFATKNGMRGR